MTGDTSLQAVHELLAKRFSGKSIRIYEAGGGSATFIQPNIRSAAEVTVLDIDKTNFKTTPMPTKKFLATYKLMRFQKTALILSSATTL